MFEAIKSKLPGAEQRDRRLAEEALTYFAMSDLSYSIIPNAVPATVWREFDMQLRALQLSEATDEDLRDQASDTLDDGPIYGQNILVIGFDRTAETGTVMYL